MKNGQYGIVLIGCGHIGQSHMEEIYYRDGVSIVGVVDSCEENARIFCKKFGAASYGTDYRPYLEREDVDVVIIATYADSHLEILKDCLNAKKHVICEKPMTTANRALAREFYEAVKASSSKVLIAHILRHNETYNRVAKMILDGAIGEVRLIRMVQNHHIMDKGRYGRLMEDCPPFVDCGVHYIDVIRWFTGLQITSIGGIGTRVGDAVGEGHYDYGMLTMTLSNGGVAYYEAGWTGTVAAENRKEFIGTNGRIRLTLQSERHSDREEGDLIEFYDLRTKTYHTINSKSIYKNMWGQLECLIGMIEGRREGSPTMEDAYKAFEISLAGMQAIQENRVIAL